MEATSKKKYVSVAELAEKLGVSRVAVFKRIKKGQIYAEKIGRAYAIPVEEVEDIENDVLTSDRKENIKKAVEKVVKEYGETLRLLGKE
ncbi:MAG: helix-turn-helix domain-containing protein [Candidatus Moraniibacteriota bacterium]